MYARPLVEARIELCQRELGFDLEYHTTSEIDDFNNRLEERHADAYQSARKAAQAKSEGGLAFQLSLIRTLCDPSSPRLSNDEIRFIKNERALCMCDAEYWLTSYYWIKTQTKIIRFEFRKAQRCFYNVIQQLHLQGAPIEIIMAKARQLGVSTVTEGLMVHAVNFAYGVNAVVASADIQKTGKMSQMTLLGYDEMPWWMKVPYSRRVQGQSGMLELNATHSGISFQHGSQTSGIARGDTGLKYHLSEVASYTNPEEQIEASLWNCVHPHPDVLGIIESSAEGNTGWFYDNYWDAKRKRANGEYARMTALFIPCTVGNEEYPNKTWIRLNPVPKDWRPIDETHDMVKRSQEYIRSNDALANVMGHNWECPRQTAWYWECRFKEHQSKGTEKLWFQEMPIDDVEAFQSSYDNVFDREVIAEVYHDRKEEYGVFAVVGQSIEERYEPEEGDRDSQCPCLDVNFKNKTRDITYSWELQPLVWKEPFVSLDTMSASSGEHMGKLMIFEEPKMGHDYSMGVRTGNGIGSGDTVVSVSRRGREAQEPDEQVAEFRSDQVSHVEAYAWTLAIAAYYSKYMGRHGVTPQQPYVAIEQIESVGDTTYLQMRKMGYRRFHKMTRYDSSPKEMKKSKSHKIGWFSSGWSTPIYLDSFVVWVRNGWYIVNSPYTIREMSHWERHVISEGKEKYLPSEESSAAGLLASALSAFCVNDMRAMAERTLKRRYDGRGGMRPKLNMDPSPEGIAFPISPIGNILDGSTFVGKRMRH